MIQKSNGFKSINHPIMHTKVAVIERLANRVVESTKMKRASTSALASSPASSSLHSLLGSYALFDPSIAEGYKEIFSKEDKESV